MDSQLGLILMKENRMELKVMKTILSVNLGNFGSTGKIMSGISEAAKKNGYIIFQGRGYNNLL